MPHLKKLYADFVAIVKYNEEKVKKNVKKLLTWNEISSKSTQLIHAWRSILKFRTPIL